MKIFLRTGLLFSTPLVLFFLISIGSFYMFDPFQILGKNIKFKNSIVGLNEDYIVTERYLRLKNEYNSFIFGSSRAGVAFKTEIWGKKLDKKSKAYSFTASNESIFGIIGKIKLVNKAGGQINNALLIIDPDITFSKYRNSRGHLYVKHPLVSGETKKEFVFECMKDYVFSGFFIRYLDYKIFKTKRRYMENYLDLTRDDLNEEYIAFNNKKREELIKEEKEEYYEKRKNIFYKRDSIIISTEKKITLEGVKYLNEIVKIFKKHQTTYKIVISPLYDQKKLNQEDLKILKQVFGEKNVYDFSGKNRFTDSKKNYYETSHYCSHVAEEILDIIY